MTPLLSSSDINYQSHNTSCVVKQFFLSVLSFLIIFISVFKKTKTLDEKGMQAPLGNSG